MQSRRGMSQMGLKKLKMPKSIASNKAMVRLIHALKLDVSYLAMGLPHAVPIPYDL